MRFVSSVLHCGCRSQRTYDPRATDDKPQMSVKNKAAFMSCRSASLQIGPSLVIYLNSSCLFALSSHSRFPVCFLPILRRSGRRSGNVLHLSSGDNVLTGCSRFSSDSKGECQCSSLKWPIISSFQILIYSASATTLSTADIRGISALAKALMKAQNETLGYLSRLFFLFSYFPSFVSFLQNLQLL